MEAVKMRTLMAFVLLIACCGVRAELWVHETSEVDPAPAPSVDICVPAGEFVCVSVGDTRRVEVVCPDGVATTNVGAVWYQSRRVYAGTERETWRAHPFYIVPLEWWPKEPGAHGGVPPDKAADEDTKPQEPRVWAVRLKVDGPPRECSVVLRGADGGSEATVNLRVFPPVPSSDAGFGFYTDFGRYGLEYRGDKWDRMRYELCRDHGLNTFTPYGNYGGDAAPRRVRQQILQAKSVGFLGDFPVFFLSGGGDQHALDLIGTAKDLGVPELLGENSDEPGAGSGEVVAANTAKWNALGLRSATAIFGQHALQFPDNALDVWIVHMDTLSETVKAECARRGKELWAYNCKLRGTNPSLHRYQTGLWMLRVKPKVLLLWALSHDNKSRVTPEGRWLLNGACEHTLDCPSGPMSTVGLEGMSDGILDYRILRRLENLIAADPHSETSAKAQQWLQRRLDDVRLTWYTPGWEDDPAYCWDREDAMPPPVTRSFGELRRQALEYIGKLEDGEKK